MSFPEGVARDPGLRLLELYDSALPQVHGYLAARCPASAVEDLTSETFLAALDSARRTRTEPTIAWLIGIARHKLVDYYRVVEREDDKQAALRALPEPCDDPWDVRLDVLRAHEVLEQLPAIHRVVLTLRYLDGLAVREVAAVLDRSAGAVESALTRAKSAFRVVYEGGAR